MLNWLRGLSVFAWFSFFYNVCYHLMFIMYLFLLLTCNMLLCHYNVIQRRISVWDYNYSNNINISLTTPFLHTIADITVNAISCILPAFEILVPTIVSCNCFNITKLCLISTTLLLCSLWCFLNNIILFQKKELKTHVFSTIIFVPKSSFEFSTHIKFWIVFVSHLLLIKYKEIVVLHIYAPNKFLYLINPVSSPFILFHYV